MEYFFRPVPITDTRMPVIGWRWWREKGGSLFSVVKNFCEWPKRVPMVVDDPNWHLDVQGPNGIHAYLLKKQLYGENYCEAGVAGSVFMWGRVCQHTGGFRAEYAYPRSFLVPPSMDPLKVMELEDGYGVSATVDEDVFYNSHVLGSVAAVRQAIQQSAVNNQNQNLMALLNSAGMHRAIKEKGKMLLESAQKAVELREKLKNETKSKP